MFDFSLIDVDMDFIDSGDLTGGDFSPELDSGAFLEEFVLPPSEQLRMPEPPPEPPSEIPRDDLRWGDVFLMLAISIGIMGALIYFEDRLWETTPSSPEKTP